MNLRISFENAPKQWVMTSESVDSIYLKELQKQIFVITFQSLRYTDLKHFLEHFIYI